MYENPILIQTKNGLIITPYERKQSAFLEANTSTYDRVYHRRHEVSGFYVENFYGKSAFITYPQAKDLLIDQFPGYEILKLPKKIGAPTEDFHLADGVQLRPVQEEMAAQILNIRGFDEWFINLQTGQGKTLLSVHLTSIFQRKTLIVCYSTDILSQWVNTYRHKTTMVHDRICFLDRTTIQQFLSGKKDPNNYDIFLGSHSLFLSQCNREGYDIFPRLMEKLQVGIVIYDEAHRNMANIIKLNALYCFSKTIYLSADYGQGDYKKEKTFFKLFRKTLLLKPSEEEERSLKYTDVVMVEYNSHPTERDKMSIKNRYGYSAEYYMNYQMKKGVIFDVLRYIIDSIYPMNNHYRTLILATNIAHVDRIAEYLQAQYPKYIVGRFHGSVPEEEQDATLKLADIIVATYKSFGTGRDEEHIRYVIGTNQSNKIEDNQAAGRARPLPDGSHVKYLFLVDRGFPYCVSKAKIRLNYLKDTKTNSQPFVFRYPDL